MAHGGHGEEALDHVRGLRMPRSVCLALLSSDFGLEQSCLLYFALLDRVHSLNHIGSKSLRSKSPGFTSPRSKSLRSKSSRFKYLWILEERSWRCADPSYSSHKFSPARLQGRREHQRDPCRSKCSIPICYPENRENIKQLLLVVTAGDSSLVVA